MPSADVINAKKITSALAPLWGAKGGGSVWGGCSLLSRRDSLSSLSPLPLAAPRRSAEPTFSRPVRDSLSPLVPLSLTAEPTADRRTLSLSRRDFFLSLSPSFLGADLPRPPSRSAGNPYGVDRIREGVIGESVPCCPPLYAVAPLWGAWHGGADRRPTFALPTGGQLTTLRPYYNPTICSRCNREQIVNLLPLRGKRFKGL